MQMQAENLRIYALAYAQWGDPEYLHAANEIARYVKTFLTSPEGAFYTSQDADLVEGKHSASYFALDDPARRKLGVPRIDRHEYARENGWMIAALATLYSATGDRQFLDAANRSAQWVLHNRALANGGFRHDAHDVAGPFLGDNAAMARAFLALSCLARARRIIRQIHPAEFPQSRRRRIHYLSHAHRPLLHAASTARRECDGSSRRQLARPL
jgi:hypothetical protein